MACKLPTDKSTWTDSDILPSSDGIYECKIRNNEREFIAVRRLKSGHWFGGCRPFSDADIVLAWREREES